MGIVAVIFIAWFAITVMVQLPWPWCKIPRKFEPTGHLLPGWHFFSPKPIIADLDLLFRCVREPGGEPDEWREIFPDLPSPLNRVVLSPHRRARKALFQSVHRILLAIEANPDNQFAVTVTVPYLLILDRITAECSDAIAVQFRIDVARQGPFPTRTAYQSPLHAVDLPVDHCLMRAV
ncbi:MAG: hypothetical protein JSS02_13625 [Planctomycetes bacterium]|nr:hypothetical protein [Planctomycetota bacterium]